ncbi:DegT/DnrJ/EryC1/StrS family aminotransferase [Shewanella halifaxensis]|uniref:DegT/DnrJ/EryC1/StrS family aminotransferase n=1 Tax=Shewanella halifaxensis TaxID=271098 RepID=UPI001F2CE1FA|nr:DegT/DnrJ/EryC1/StrS family aminotransferase [Shewanella halifaxensis]
MAIKYPIVRPVLPLLSEYQKYIEGVFERNWLTNNGPLHYELETRLADYLGVDNLMLVANGTLALQVAYQALELTESASPILTTPFSFAATASSIGWHGHKCEFVDIDPTTLNLEPNKITLKQLSASSAVVATHVFGNPCDVKSFEALSKQHNIKIIYDAAHAFGCDFDGESVLKWGDASTLSLHSTKIFHSVEGGAIVFKKEDDLIRARQMINFGFNNKQYPDKLGINAKMSEVHAAMGLSLLDNINVIQEQRIRCTEAYHYQLKGVFEFQTWSEKSSNNGAYMPVLCHSESQLLSLMPRLLELGIQTRRYFYPSLSEVPCYGMNGDTPIANDISRRILCLPLYANMTLEDVTDICSLIKKALVSLD